MSNSEMNELRELFNSSNGDADAILAGLAVFIIFIVIICLLSVIFKVISRWIFFKKCGEEGWKSLIPFYTDYTVIKIAGLNWWWFLILFAGTILSSLQSSFNVLEDFDSSSSLGPIVVIFSVISIFASIATLLARINISYNIAKKFNKGAGYTILILFFESIMFLVLGISKKEVYDEATYVSPNGLFGNKVSKPTIYCPDCGSAVNDDYCPKCGKKVR